MFEQISGAHQAMLWLAAIMVIGFTMFTVFTLVPLIRFLEVLINKVGEIRKADEQNQKEARNFEQD